MNYIQTMKMNEEDYKEIVNAIKENEVEIKRYKEHKDFLLFF